MDMMTSLLNRQELIPDEYDGSYELVRAVVGAYSRLDDLSAVDHKDLLLLYFATTTLDKQNALDLKIKISHLPPNEKTELVDLTEKLWKNAENKKYLRRSSDGSTSIGMFEASYQTFDRHNPKTGKRLTIAEDSTLVTDFIRLCIDIADMKSDDEIFSRCDEVLTDRYIGSGFGVGSASQILHCLKPYTFPIILPNDTTFTDLGIELTNPTRLSYYITNARIIKEFRDSKFGFLNYVLFTIPPETAAVQLEKNVHIEPVRSIFPLNQIFFGPPGTGKTYLTVKHAVSIVENREIDPSEPYEEILKRYDEYTYTGRIKFATFHQSFSYEDFVEGIKPLVVDRYGKESTSANADTHMVYITKEGIFKKSCLLARKNPNFNYVMIIDEINRGNISRIFGELITLIEDTKRGMEAALPYSGEMFSIPANLHIIGTMNTADRSIALLDTALRRRFSFKEMMPDPSLLSKDCEGVDLQKMLEAMNQRIEYYYDREHTIGHAYFMENGKSITTLKKLKAVFESRIIPLMQEYFFDDYEKIMLVFNDDENNRFITEMSVKYIRNPERRSYQIADISRLETRDFVNIYGDVHE